MRKCILTLLALFMIGCSSTSNVVSTPTATSETLDTLEEYADLESSDMFTILDKTGVENMLNHGTGVVYFSFPECPWCQRYITYLSSVASEYDVNVKYYNIRKDKGTDWYTEIAELIHEKEETISRYDNDGNYVIYMPLTIFLKDGEIIGYDDTSCDLDSDEIAVEDYWTQENIDNLNTKLSSYFSITKLNIEEGNKEGCAVKVEDGCN